MPIGEKMTSYQNTIDTLINEFSSELPTTKTSSTLYENPPSEVDESLKSRQELTEDVWLKKVEQLCEEVSRLKALEEKIKNTRYPSYPNTFQINRVERVAFLTLLFAYQFVLELEQS